MPRPSAMPSPAGHLPSAFSISRRRLLRRTSALLFGGLALFGLPACQAEAAPEKSSGRPQVLATVGMIADLAEIVAGEALEVDCLIPAGVDPHLHRPTRSDSQRLLAADILLVNGRHLEGRMGETFAAAEKAGRRVLRISEVLPLPLAGIPQDLESDPHLWMDPSLWAGVPTVLAEAFAARAPEHAKAFHQRAGALEATLRRFDAWAQERLATIPANQRILVTAHDAFRWFGRRYDLPVRGLQGISTDSEAGLEAIQSLVSLLVEREVQAVFIESTLPARAVEALVEGAKARGHQVRIGGELHSDALGAEGTYTGTYLGMLDHNVTTIVRALGGEVDPAGFQGRLEP